MRVIYLSVFLALSVLHIADAGAQQRPLSDPGERFFPSMATVEERYARDVYLELMRVQPQMIDKQYERHRRNATVEVSFTVGKNGQVRALKIARSSGDSELEKIVISSIQSTRFTPPPDGVKPDFLLPLQFRLN